MRESDHISNGLEKRTQIQMLKGCAHLVQHFVGFFSKSQNGRTRKGENTKKFQFQREKNLRGQNEV